MAGSMGKVALLWNVLSLPWCSLLRFLTKSCHRQPGTCFPVYSQLQSWTERIAQVVQEEKIKTIPTRYDVKFAYH